ncbi:hypothetical protein NCAS_0A07240 [Naumovozyma castellii]|uniref:Threonyl/alanyl tRNA synthetase SAD domain-containing protein n=1 Tax=Naumovozyma castellii TaxID=27288 RepID=G0V734_NAUCA|nr:hypothetical protein NCAS_0A07240 [Naumovozyma castellii CBS 4309]CCC67282.1 hypothetical protein NCAS_0A07240 [Naumovozyma castellii CBS 4309]
MTKATTSVVVGQLACQKDSFCLDNFQTTVISCKELKGTPTKYEVELQDTILFPEGGGQPSDTGTITIVSSGDIIPVKYVYRVGLHANHMVSQYIEPGTKVDLTVDSEKRIDYMQQHTGQHLLSALLESQYALNTLSWSMGGVPKEKNGIAIELEPSDYFNYIELSRKLTEEEIKNVTTLMRKYIVLDPQVITVKERNPQETVTDDASFSKIPEDYDMTNGVIRTIHIGNLDSNPCCGTHLNSTATIGGILISRNQTSVRGTNSRLYFMCGNRIAQYGEFANDTLLKLKSSFSCGETQIMEKVEQQKEQLQKSNKRERFWIKELAILEAKKILLNLKDIKGRTYLLKDEFGTLEYLLAIFKELSSVLKEEQNNYKEYLIVLCGRETQTKTGPLMIISESGEKINEVSTKLSSMIETLKGGGGKKGGKWQGKISSFSNNDWDSLAHYLNTDYMEQH